MANNKENTLNGEETNNQEKEVDIKPSETDTSKTGDPGRTPGKAEGEDDESATK
ncbi:MAG TPA: hypothetical protein VIL74_03415 [Pyrinomonadaceae bacterium]|jgi:hypothetical protein